MRELVALRVTITRGVRGKRTQNIYPDFNSIAPEIRRNMDWAHYVDEAGIGWLYDKVAAFGESDAYSPDPGVQFGMLCVPEDFALEALRLFPSTVVRLTAAEAAAFYGMRSNPNEPEELVDDAVLERLIRRVQAEQLGLLPAPTPAEERRRRDALDPALQTPGVTHNPCFTFAHFAEHLGICIREAQ